MVQEKRMEEMSWIEFEECSKVFDTILLPMCSGEEEGPHLPLAVHSILAWEVAGRAGEGCDALVGPLISVGFSDWHAAFPNTLSLNMNPHIGNDAPIFSVATELTKGNRAIVALIDL